MKQVWLALFLFCSFLSHAQDTNSYSETNLKRKVIGVSAAYLTSWTTSTVLLKNVWYKESWTSNFHFFNDNSLWLGMDKMGHVFTSYAINKNTTQIYQWADCPPNTSLLIGSSISLGYMTTIEILDGFSNDWGFSWGDIMANALGVSWYAWQKIIWNKEKIKLKFSAHLSPYAQYRPNVLGAKFQERILKDYNGQTYWLSVSPGQFLSNSKFPKWLALSVGYGIDQKIHGEQNTYIIDNQIFKAKSHVLLSLDIDFEEIPTDKKWLKTIFKVINHVKVPFPALLINKNKVKVFPIYF